MDRIDGLSLNLEKNNIDKIKEFVSGSRPRRRG